jgi:nanoRNase/pAp phosphatase (c-di-AMP/oligoRNAs hydrolase)
MTMFLTNWGLIIEITIAVVFVLGILIIGSFLIVKSLRKSFRDVFKFQSKFDIELRKIVNLLSKMNGNGKLKLFQDVVIKELSHENKQIVLTLVEELYEGIDKESESNSYLVETYENLQETRRIRDSKAIIFNHKILMFPFNLFAKVLKMKPWHLLTKPE